MSDSIFTFKKKEFADNIHDPIWRIQNLYPIVNKKKEKQLLKLNEVQTVLADNYDEQYQSVLKPRQKGVSTYYLIKYLDACCFQENVTACILAHETDSIKKLFRIVRYAYQNMPKWLQPEIYRGGGSMYEMFFPNNNSRIYCDLESRSDTISHLHVSEVAFIKFIERLEATLDAVPVTTGVISYETTAFGLNHFYDWWKKEDWPFKRFFFPWYFDKEYSFPTDSLEYSEEENALLDRALKNYNIEVTKEQIAWRRFKVGQKDKRHFLQEYPEDDKSCFLLSGEPVLDRVFLSNLLVDCPNVIAKNGLIIFKEYDKTKEYVIGADTSEGIGRDYSVAKVICINSMEEVAVLRGQYSPSDFALLLIELGKTYQLGAREYPIIAVERNNHGHAVLLKLNDEQYPNLYKGKDSRLGWLNNSVSRPIAMDTLLESVVNNQLKIYHKETINELMTLVDNNGKIEAEKGKHDDCVISSAIALQLAIESVPSTVYNNIGSLIY